LYRPARSAEPEESSSVSEKPALTLAFPQRLPDSSEQVASEVVPVKRVYQPEWANGAGSDSTPQTGELVKGFETSKGHYVILGEEELRQIAPKNSTEMEIVEFVRFDEVDPIYLETSYYVVPDGSGEKAYALLFDALREEGHAAVTQVTMHRRDHVMIVRAGQTGHTLFYDDEVRTVEEFRTDTTLVSVKERDLAKALIDAMVRPFEPERFQNQFRDQLQRLIQALAAEQRAVAIEAQSPAPSPVNIMDALKRSLAEVKAAPAQRRPPRAEKSVQERPRRKTSR
jgi:DNA end-binding protein Ku